MDAGALKALQAPLKERYRETPEAAVITLKAEGRIGEGVTCSVGPARRWSRPGCTPPPAAAACMPAPATCCSRRWSPAPA